MKSLLLATFALLAGCYSVDEIRERPPVWTARYSVSFDTMTNCLAAQWAGNGSVAPQLYAAERRGAVTIGVPQSGTIFGDYQIRTNADSTIDVEWRAPSPRAALSRERADRCAA